MTAVLTLPVGDSVRDRECDQELKGTLVMDEHSVRTKFRFMLIYKIESDKRFSTRSESFPDHLRLSARRNRMSPWRSIW